MTMTKDSSGLITRNERAIAYRSSLAHLGCSKGKNMETQSGLSLSDVRQEAKKYTSRTEFVKLSPTAYHWAWRKKVLDDVCGHMPISSLYSEKRWSHETVAIEARKYTSRAVFRRSNEGAYGYALNNGILDAVCSHMLVLKKTWDEKSIREEAGKYESRREFKKTSPTAYRVACRKGILESVCENMDRVRRWNKESVISEAAKYETKSLFFLNSPGAYKHALKNSFLDEACAHMPKERYGFDPDKPASLYCMKITNKAGVSLYKVGITNRSAARRAIGLGAKTENNVEIINEIRFEHGSLARNVERDIHSQYSGLKYRGAPIMSNGNKEVFYKNVLLLHQAQQVN